MKWTCAFAFMISTLAIAPGSASTSYENQLHAPCKLFVYVQGLGVIVPKPLETIARARGYAITDQIDEADHLIEWKITYRPKTDRNLDGSFSDVTTGGRGLYEFFGRQQQVSYRQSVKNRDRYFRQIDELEPLYGAAWGGSQSQAVSRAIAKLPLASGRKTCGVPETYQKPSLAPADE